MNKMFKLMIGVGLSISAAGIIGSYMINKLKEPKPLLMSYGALPMAKVYLEDYVVNKYIKHHNLLNPIKYGEPVIDGFEPKGLLQLIVIDPPNRLKRRSDVRFIKQEEKYSTIEKHLLVQLSVYMNSYEFLRTYTIERLIEPILNVVHIVTLGGLSGYRSPSETLVENKMQELIENNDKDIEELVTMVYDKYKLDVIGGDLMGIVDLNRDV